MQHHDSPLPLSAIVFALETTLPRLSERVAGHLPALGASMSREHESAASLLDLNIFDHVHHIRTHLFGSSAIFFTIAHLYICPSLAVLISAISSTPLKPASISDRLW